MKALVTGGAGFIGSHLVEHLLTCGDNVTVIDDFSTGCEANLAPVRKDIRLVRGSITDAACVAAAMDGIEVVYHLAAMISVYESFDRRNDYLAVNVTGTQLLLEEAHKAGVQQFVFSSSCSVYGDAAPDVVDETTVLNPKSPYAVSKQMGEALCNTYALTTPMQTVALRYFNVYGPRQADDSDYSSVLQRFISARLKQQPATIYGSGEQSRDFVHVSDVARANRLVAQHCRESHQNNAHTQAGLVVCYNVGTGQSLSVNTLHQVIQQQVPQLPVCEPEYRPMRQGDVLKSRADISRITKAVGYGPKVPLDEGIAELVAYRQSLLTLPVGQ